MKTNAMRLTVALLLGLLLSACKTVTVSNPTANQVYTTAPDITLTFPKGKPDTLKVLLNRTDITSQLTVTTSGATLAAASAAKYLVDGENFIEITTPATPTVKFSYDISGPMVHITKVTEGSSLAIQGYVEDPSGVKSVTVNGAALALGTGGSFSTTIANATNVTFVSTDNNNLVRSQKFARPSVSVTNSMALRINRNGLNFLTAEVERLLEGATLGKSLSAMNPILNKDFFVAAARVDALDATMRDASLALAIQPAADGTVGVSGKFTGLWARFKVTIDWPWPLPNSDINGTLTLDSAAFNGGSRVTISNGKPVLTISSLGIDLETIRTDISMFPDWLLIPFYEAFEWLFEWILADQVKQILPKKMGELLDTFPDSLVLNIAGNQIKPTILPATIGTPSNGINISLGAKLTAITSNGPKVLGSPWKDMPSVPAATNTSPSGVTKDVGVVISSNMINQALSAATASGMLNVSLTQNDIPGLSTISGISTEQIRVRLIPASAPTIELIKAANGLGTLRIHDMYMGVDGTIDDTNTLKTVLGATIDLEVTADLGVTPNSAIAVEVIGVPRVKVRSIDPASALILSPALSQKFLDEVSLKVIPVVMSKIGAVPLPSFEGYSLSVGDIWVTDNNANFVALVASMVRGTVTASAPAPSTSAYVEGGTVSARSGLFKFSASSAVEVAGDVAVIKLEGYNPSEGRMQYRYSLDGAPMSLWKEREEIRLPGLPEGLHEVNVCARTALLVEDPYCTTVSFHVDR